MAEANSYTSREEANSPSTVPSFALWDGIRVLCTLGIVLGGFALAGSVVLVLYTRQHPELDAIQAPAGLLIRAGLFGVVTLLSGIVLWCIRLKTPYVALPPAPVGKLSHRALISLLALLTIMVVLLGTHLDSYPWAAPDEVHHLNLARNVAVYGSYASGRPETGFQYFDSFDSVGPTVIGAIALAFKMAGVSLGVARTIMIAFFLLLCVAVFQFCRCLFGPWAGVASVGLLVGTFSSIYLGRTVYGEVPSFAYLLLGLLAWHRALKSPGFTVWALAAGALV
ncbi:MAG: glycosyltransferase family 39 protein, partial [Candidatus Hydrogenedentes bacterium]|nr:glycosyltransferase family 39 protein [Candidatus Hydrogenedentota bacterium]